MSTSQIRSSRTPRGFPYPPHAKVLTCVPMNAKPVVPTPKRIKEMAKRPNGDGSHEKPNKKGRAGGRRGPGFP
jgi:hypothetical protein